MLFRSIPGVSADGRAFIPQALTQGAAAVLAPTDTPGDAAPVLVRSGDVRRAYALAAKGQAGVAALIDQFRVELAGALAMSGHTSLASLRAGETILAPTPR